MVNANRCFVKLTAVLNQSIRSVSEDFVLRPRPVCSVTDYIRNTALPQLKKTGSGELV